MIVYRTRKRHFAGGMTPSSSKAKEMRLKPGLMMEKNTHRYTHLTAYIIRSGPRDAMC
jgi:hypothetical protein